MEAGARRFGLVGEAERGERLYSPGERVRCRGDGVRRRGGGRRRSHSRHRAVNEWLTRIDLGVEEMEVDGRCGLR